MYLWNRAYHLGGGLVKYYCVTKECGTRISNAAAHYKYRPVRCAACVRRDREAVI